MYIKQYSKLAEALLFAHGDNAQCEARRMADMYEKTGHPAAASQWRETLTAVKFAKEQLIRAAA
jgi:hypothetical protein